MEVLRRVPVLRRVAAADMAAFPAQPQVNPGVTHRKALLAAVGVGRVGANVIEMGATGRHVGAHLR